MAPMALKVAKRKTVISTVGKPSKSQRGFTFILVMAALVIIAILAEVASVSNQYRVKRDREAELLFRGQAYVRAIKSYYEAKPNLEMFPRNLEQLLSDSRFVHKQHIRKLYTDPITGEDWQLVRGNDGGISGVVSSSTDVPLKQSGFPIELQQFEGAESYNEWIFEYRPKTNNLPVNQQAINTNSSAGSGK
jgi:type II secretory pathway pseudopilin PulG